MLLSLLLQIAHLNNFNIEFLIQLECLERIGVTLQRSEMSLKSKSAACELILTLASIHDYNSIRFINLLEKLLLTNHFPPKHACILMIKFAASANAAFKYNLLQIEVPLFHELCRMLTSSSIHYQYECVDVISLILKESRIGDRLTSSLVALLCLRYIPGGAQVIGPNLKYTTATLSPITAVANSTGAGTRKTVVYEAPEVIIIMFFLFVTFFKFF